MKIKLIVARVAKENKVLFVFEGVRKLLVHLIFRCVFIDIETIESRF